MINNKQFFIDTLKATGRDGILNVIWGLNPSDSLMRRHRPDFT